jgi:TonB family protein
MVSLLIHAMIMSFVVFWAPQMGGTKSHVSSPIPVEIVQRPSELIKTLQPEATEKPDDANFVSDRDLKADEETSPELAALDMPSAGTAGAAKGRSVRESKPKTRESFGLSSADKEALEDPLQGGQAREFRQFSPGFQKRLKRGEQLKVNAFGLDYGQYYLRMKERLAQRWRPLSVISPAMYNYDEVQVLVAIVLNSAGELVDLEILRPSFFSRYDQVAIDAIKAAAPFPNPPKSIIQDDGRVYVTWGFVLNIGRSGLQRGIQ